MMNEDRFRALAQAYGADIELWPASERSQARAVASSDRAFADAVLDAERNLERRLDAFVVEASPALRRRVVDLAPRARAIARAWRWATAAGLGLGLAASAVAGVAAGVSFAPAGVARLVVGAPVGATDDSGLLADPAGDLVNG